jgi:hypothetical protein
VLGGSLEKELLYMGIRDYAELIESIVTVVAILVGGIWSYFLFVQNRQRYPRANVQITVTHKKIPNKKILIHVKVAISNIGNILLSIVSLETRLQCVLPISTELEGLTKGKLLLNGETEIEWPLIDSYERTFNNGDYEIEPNETQEMCFDFIVDNSTQTVAIYCYIKNQKKRRREIGWDSTVLYDLNEEKKTR